MYADEQIQILNNKALEDIRRIQKCVNMTMAGKYYETNDVLKQLDKDIRKMTRKKKNKDI